MIDTILHKKYFLFLVVAAGILTACTHDESNDPADVDPIEVTFTAIKDRTALPVSRTTNGGTIWEQDDEIGVYMKRTGTTLQESNILTEDGLTADNLKYLAQPDNPPSTAFFWLEDASKRLLYPRTGNVDFIAYYPWIPTGTGSNEINNYVYPINILNQDSPEKIDVLYSNNVTNRVRNSSPAELEFSHVLSKLIINIKKGAGMEKVDFNYLEVECAAFPYAASLELRSGTITGIQNSTVGDELVAQRKAVADPGYVATYETIVIPESGRTGRQVRFTLNAGHYYWNIDSDVSWLAGKSHTYEITINETGLSISKGSIDSWINTPNSAGNGDMTPIPAEIQPEANSYMVPPGGNPILIPVSQANRVFTADAQGAVITGLTQVTKDNFTIELVWGDLPIGRNGVIRSIERIERNDKGYILVEPGVAGNAVIGIKIDGEQDYRWSWHIWVTEPITTGRDPIIVFTWMDRNLGAGGADTWQAGGKNGLFYQWGRKDAFPASDGTDNIQSYYTEASGNTPVNANPTGDYTELHQLVKYPLHFARNYDTYRGSIAGEGDNNSWGGQSDNKTLYDPCPPGWKVPPIKEFGQNVWGNASVWDAWNDNGRLFRGLIGLMSVSHYYPAAGFRYTSTGTLYTVGTNGYYWSASPIGVDGYSLYFTSSDVYPARNYQRADGFSVRCVQE